MRERIAHDGPRVFPPERFIQPQATVLLEVGSPLHAAARDAISPFAELEKSPEHIHTYRLSPLSVWNAAATGLDADQMLAALERYAKYPLPPSVGRDIREWVSRYGRVRLISQDGGIALESDDPLVLAEIAASPLVNEYLLGPSEDGRLPADPAYRGHLKQALIRVGYPVEDLAGYVTGGALEGAYRIGDFSLNGSGGVYRVSNRNRPQDADWTQPRFDLSVSYRFGYEPSVRSTSMMGAYR